MLPTLRFALALFCCGAVLVPAGPEAQTSPPSPVYRVAMLGADPTQVWDAFQRRLRELGYVEGRNLTLERRWSSGYEDRLPKLAAELLRGNPDVLVTSSMLPSDARIDPAQCVPILVIAVSEPYGPCRASPVARMSPSSSARALASIHLRLAREALSSVSRLAVLTNSDRPFLVEYVKALEAETAAAGVGLHVLDVSADADLASLAAAVTRAAPDALIVGPGFMRPDLRRQIVGFATARGIPSIGSYVADGVVIAADYDWVELARRAADFVDRLLQGTQPADLATGAPVKFEVVVDARRARSLGLTIPDSVLSQADRVLN